MVNIFKKYFFPPLYGLLVYFTIRLLLDSVTGMKFWRDRDWRQNAFEWIYCILFSYLFIAACNRLFRFFDQRWPATDLSYKRVVRELLWLFGLNLVFQNLLLLPLAAFTDDGAQWYDVVDLNTVPLLYSLVYYGIARSSTFLKAYIDGKVQLEKITTDQLQTELKFLKAQYHPHFLFNALNTIYFQMDENVAAAKKSVEKFSELLRYQLYDQQQTVPVSQELHYLHNFIQLQQTRTSEKLQLDLAFDPALNGQQVYPLLFLPLVENAFKYIGGDYHLRICAVLRNNIIEFKVVNSVPEKIPVIHGAAEAETRGETEIRGAAETGIRGARGSGGSGAVGTEGRGPGAKGIGLENLQRRLELLYPRRHTLTAGNQGTEFIAVLTLQYH